MYHRTLFTPHIPLHLRNPGVVVGCLRKLQRWSTMSIFEEYRRFACGGLTQQYNLSHQRQEQFMELFDTDLVQVIIVCVSCVVLWVLYCLNAVCILLTAQTLALCLDCNRCVLCFVSSLLNVSRYCFPTLPHCYLLLVFFYSTSTSHSHFIEYHLLLFSHIPYLFTSFRRPLFFFL